MISLLPERKPDGRKGAAVADIPTRNKKVLHFLSLYIINNYY